MLHLSGPSPRNLLHALASMTEISVGGVEVVVVMLVSLKMTTSLPSCTVREW